MGHLQRIVSAEAINQLSELDQVRHTKERALLAEDGLWIWIDNVGPLRRNGADALPSDQQQASSMAGIPLAHAHELLSTQGMKGMRDTHKARRCDRTIRILD